MVKFGSTMAKAKPAAKQPSLLRRLIRHLKADPARLPVVSQEFAPYERANLHLAMQSILAATAKVDLVGILDERDYDTTRLARLARAATAKRYDRGPVEYVDVELADGRQLACVKRGLY